MLALSSRPWICYNYLSRYFMVPMTYEALDYVAPFSSSECKEGVVAIAGNTLRIISPERLGDIFNQTVVPLRYSPKKMVKINPLIIYN